MTVFDFKWQALLIAVLVLHLHYLHNPFVEERSRILLFHNRVSTSDCSDYKITLVCASPTSSNVSVNMLLYIASPLLGPRLCGTILLILTTQNQVWIRCKSDSSYNYNGFRALFSTCGGYFNYQYGIIYSPSYPSNYTNNLDCSYVIRQTAGYFVGLIFTDFYLEGGTGCSYDYIEIRDGSTQTSPQIGSRFCGSTIPPFLKSSQDSLFIRFRSDGSRVYRGFQASYTRCGGRFTSSFGLLTSPSYPGNYSNNLDCSYVITQNGGYFVALIFTEFQLQLSVNCSSDFLEIRDGSTQTSPQIGTRLCGNTIPPFLKTSQGSMSIRFRSDTSGVNKGFKANYTSNNVYQSYYPCGGTFTSAQGDIQSPSYPSNYHSNMDCIYVISMPTGYRINISFSSFSLEGGGNCLNDYLEIRDGGSQTSPILGQRLCGTTMPPSQTTSQHLSRIHFKSDNSLNYKGFKFSYTSSCVQYYSGKQGVIQSPSFPSNYPNNIDCAYVINQQPGYRIYLNFTDFMLQSGSNCLEDYVEVRDGGSASSPLIGNRFCGSSIPPIMKSTQNIMRIRFKSNYALTYSGFKALYHVACGSVFTLQQSSISISSTLNYYLSGQECVYVIAQPQGYRITLNFTKFNLISGTNCTSDYVEVLDGESPSSPILGSRFCGVILPPVQRSTQNTMSIRFKIELFSSNKGFQAVYTADVIPQEIVLVTDNASVIHMDLETRSYSHISTASMQQPMGVDYDPVEDRVYWTDIARGEIWSSRLNHTDFRMMYFLGRNSRPYGIAVDAVSRFIFYTEARNNTIGRLTMSNLSHKLLVTTDLDEPRAITVDKINRLIFWSQVGIIPQIERANYDASDRTTLVSTSLKYPSAIAVDVESDQLFWVDSGTDILGCINLEGKNRKSIYLSSDKHFVGIAIFSNHLYLTDWGRLGPNTISSYVRRMDKDGQNESIVATFTGHLHNIRIYSERSQHPESNSNTSNDSATVIGVTCGVAALVIIIIVSIIVVIKWRKAKGMTNRNTQPTITVNTTYEGLNHDKNGTSRAEGESSVYATIEEHRAETHQIDNPAFSGNIGSNKFLNHPVYEK